MRFSPTEIVGSFLIEIEKREDDRGFFGRAWCEREFREHGLNPHISQVNVAYSRLRGTLRGLHYQIAPHEEAKLVRCTRGAIYEVLVDLRRGSPTHRIWLGMELSAESYRMLYVPEGCANGYLTLEDDTEIMYQVSRPYAPDAERGVRYDDKAFGIQWPIEVRVMSQKDLGWPGFLEAPTSGREGGRAVVERSR